MHPQRHGEPSPDRRSRAVRASGVRRPNRASPHFGGLTALGAGRSLLPAVALVLSVVWAIRHPYGVPFGAAAALWLLWPLVGFGSLGPLPGPRGTLRLRVRYMGGHPACPLPGRALLTVWPEDGAATLRVGRHAVAFPLHAVRSLALADGRIELPVGAWPWVAHVWGRVAARGVGRFRGVRRCANGFAAVVDRSRVICDLTRGDGACRMILTGPRGGGEDVYLEALVLLRPNASGSGAGAPGGARGGQTIGGL